MSEVSIITRAGDMTIPAMAIIDKQLYALTEWFDDGIKPARVGVYQRDYKGMMGEQGEPDFCLWDGTEWYLPFDTPSEARKSGKSPWLASDFQHLPWRGLTKPVREKLA